MTEQDYRHPYWTSRERQVMSSNKLQQTVEFIAEQAASNARMAITLDRMAKEIVQIIPSLWTYANEQQAEGRLNCNISETYTKQRQKQSTRQLRGDRDA